MIAKQLGFSVETIEDALNLLISKGYLSRDSITPSTASCIGCTKSCSVSDTPSIIYKLTEKGKEYAMV
jgi:Mn-dependent DtxR family transcriptional regulator